MQHIDNKSLEQLISIESLDDFKIYTKCEKQEKKDLKDNYSEIEIYKSIKKKDIQLLLCCAIQTAIVGIGNNVFIDFYKDGEKINVDKIYKEMNIKDKPNKDLRPGDLTPERLRRFYRLHIYEYIIKNPNIYPLLWKKYSTVDIKYKAITFPGSEYLIEDKIDGFYLLKTYINLDKKKGTDITKQIKKILLNRCVLDTKDIEIIEKELINR